MCLSDHERTEPWPPARWHECNVAYLLRVMPDKDGATLTRWLASERPISEIAADVAAEHHGIPVKAQSLRRHRKGDCECLPTVNRAS